VDVFQALKDKLELTLDNRLMLDGVAMILTPRWFFVGIMNRVAEEAGPEIAAKVYYEAGYEGAYKWGNVQIGKGLSGRAVMEQYLSSMTHRGWGRFEIVSFDETQGRGLFWFYDSAMALELGQTGQRVCTWVAGALAGGFQVILDHARSRLKVRGRETKCLSEGKPHCEFVVEPATG
jgi:predicted hydrocarbon binding protein